MKFEIVNYILSLPRLTKQLIIVLIDSTLIITALIGSFSMRLGFFFWPSGDIFWLIFTAPIFSILAFYSFGMYKSITRYIGFQALFSLFQAVTLYAVVWGLLGYMTFIDGIPRSVIIINWMLSLILIGGSRLIALWFFAENKQIKANKNTRTNVIIYGAGSSGRELSNSLKVSNKFNHIAYVDGNKDQIGNYLNNIPIYGPEKIQFLIDKYDVKELLVMLPDISRNKKNKIIKKLNELPVKVRSLPSVTKFAEGKIKINDLLEIDIFDLLGREQIEPDKKLLQINITNKVVMVTGAGGSIGSELSFQIIQQKPKKIILFDISEPSLYLIEQRVKSLEIDGVEILPVLGSVTSKKRVEDIIKFFSVDTIYHAAAYKHVPLVEFNQNEGVFNNSIGTMIVSQAAIKFDVETFVLISTDKAVRPTNVMGASKRVSELILQALSKEKNSTCFTMVRFGNVLNSSGSVIPLFKKQIKDGGPITLTDANIVRYFMTIPEAVELVIQSGAMASGGDVFVLDMGEPVRIYDLALKMIQLSGLQVKDSSNPDGDINIIYTGLRPGEKLYEELIVGENVSKTSHKRIMRAEEEMIEWKLLKPIIEKMKDASIKSESEKIRFILSELIPSYQPKSQIVDLIYNGKSD